MDSMEPRRMALRGLHHLTAICQDLERTKSFYVGVLGMNVVGEGVSNDDPDARHLWLGFGQHHPTLLSFLEYGDMDAGQVGVGMTHHFALVVETADEHQAWLGYLRGRAVQCSEIFDRGGFRSIYMRDPDGHIVEIATRAPSSDVVAAAESYLAESAAAREGSLTAGSAAVQESQLTVVSASDTRVTAAATVAHGAIRLRAAPPPAVEAAMEPVTAVEAPVAAAVVEPMAASLVAPAPEREPEPEPALQPEPAPEREPATASAAGHGRIRLRPSAPVAALAAAISTPASAPQSDPDIAALQRAAHEAAEAAYEAYNLPHGQRPAASAAGLLHAAARAAQALAAAKTSKGR